MRNRTSAQAKQIEAEVAARKQKAYQDTIDSREMRAAQALVSRELGGVEIVGA